MCLLNHDTSRVLGSTKQGNIELFEDNIGLRAICKITDSEVIEKAKKGKLRDWSFGFEALKEHEEELENGLKRRFVDEMDLDEVSIIDEHRIPCYVGTSIETRAEKNSKIEYRGEAFKAKIIDKTEPEIDYSEYEKILKQIGGIKMAGIGLKNFKYAKLDTDGETYGTVSTLAGAIECKVTLNLAEANTLLSSFFVQSQT